MFESERPFISSSKSIVQGIVSKKISKQLAEIVSDEAFSRNKSENMIKMSEWIDCLVNLGGLRDFVAGFFKGILTEMGDRVKKIFQQNIQELDGSLEKSLMPFVILNAKSLIFFAVSR